MPKKGIVCEKGVVCEKVMVCEKGTVCQKKGQYAKKRIVCQKRDSTQKKEIRLGLKSSGKDFSMTSFKLLTTTPQHCWRKNLLEFEAK